MKRIAILILAGLLSSGCSTVVSSLKEEPIKEDPTDRTTGSFVDDELIEIKSNVNISKGSVELSSSHVNVTSFNGIVLLTGQVATEESRMEAEQIVSQVRKIRRIHNELTVTSPTSTLTRASDVWITAKIKANMIGDKQVDATQIKVVTENGVVYLMGLVTRAQADNAIRIVRGVNGIQKIVKIFEYID
ncbi:Osmotically-inducible protein OsmY, contains BON domain [Amphritea atlantica]|uniref:Osmotically-inducible protein OsmY, contains BON domain n=1 Tax=Amphritea atlantica TaxID=355243 RepID=A0A1H9M1S1_9GAMM|nr:BON domain-containing protein [Amphritea atlantica]SER17425.1 Osmotically-inducible protein OsmY, contains BON domain [Amphritea atlantica]